MTDFETNEIGTEQALREALELLDVEVMGSLVETWRENGPALMRHKSIVDSVFAGWRDEKTKEFFSSSEIPNNSIDFDLEGEK